MVKETIIRGLFVLTIFFIYFLLFGNINGFNFATCTGVCGNIFDIYLSFLTSIVISYFVVSAIRQRFYSFFHISLGKILGDSPILKGRNATFVSIAILLMITFVIMSKYPSPGFNIWVLLTLPIAIPITWFVHRKLLK